MEDSETVERRCDLPFGSEYAKSNRSTCKGCKATIGQDSLRMSAREPSRFFDGLQDNWFHAGCFFNKLKPGKDQINERSIRGVDILKWDDQEWIRSKITEFNDHSKFGATTSHGNTYRTLKVELSKSNRGKCFTCRNFFQTREVKIGLKSNWHHTDCLLTDEVKAKFTGSPLEIVGFGELPQDTQASLTTRLAPPEKKAEEKTEDTKENSVAKEEGGLKTEAKTEDAPKAKRFKFQPKSAEEKRKEALKKQTELLWELKTGFQQNLKKSEMIKLLEENDQIPPSEESKILDLLVDCALFGKPARCPKCPNGQIVFSLSERTYICLGFMSEFTKCRYKDRNPLRSPFTISYKMIDANAHLQTVMVNRLSSRTYCDESEAIVNRDNCSTFKYLGARGMKHAAEAYVDGVKSMGTGTGKSRQIIKNGTVVDGEFEFAEECHVHKDSEGVLYMSTLSSTDMVNNTNSYYKMNLFKADPGRVDRFYLFRSWGRVGTNVGGTQTETFLKEDRAIVKFEELFLEKTGNLWENRKYFIKKAGKFSMVETDYSEFKDVKSETVVAGSLTKLHRSIKEVIMMIFDVESMKSALKEFELDLDRMPLGKLSKKQIMSAYEVLKELEQIFSASHQNNDLILDATNRFYTLMPHNFGMKAPVMLDSPELLKKKCSMLDSLLDIELALNVLQEEKQDAKKMVVMDQDPVDVHYRKLGCDMEYVSPGSEEFAMVQKYLKNTHGKTHSYYNLELVDLIRLSRHGEKEKFKKNLGNRMLLWHGSRISNFGGILSQGLRIAPPEAPATGYMFGKGVYFADMVSKSANYCRTAHGGKGADAFLLLCDVALGNVQEERHAFASVNAKVKPGFHSVKGTGQTVPDPSDVKMHSEGYRVPYGKSHTLQQMGQHGVDYSLLYNEYIVYNVDQINMRYLVRTKVK